MDQRPPVAELVADTSAEDLHDALVDLFERHPALVRPVESQFETHAAGAEGNDARDRTPEIDAESIRQKVRSVLPSIGGPSTPAVDPSARCTTDLEPL